MGVRGYPIISVETLIFAKRNAGIVYSYDATMNTTATENFNCGLRMRHEGAKPTRHIREAATSREIVQWLGRLYLAVATLAALVYPSLADAREKVVLQLR